ncbi:MAG: DUF547 domain-containing protein [Gammaproteobacteria bacterium]|jgi:hypothetical protein|nr:DUF547 domain-containing protein [Gammaproteobacteria bacterium]MBT3859644.1 DUF547 domain-containing protein [Gammaproteobacteria bacterium]MBT3987617.1 DUF547 domain-containing protein [Gammaproteobacteria bacterium]MBT4254526.1 DUF547 domain-containing protein [Gammaproteobacteria bacterium]MBT4581643.1 DUF547 domain-containing protein [Gammaproteobacteria bacterium]
MFWKLGFFLPILIFCGNPSFAAEFDHRPWDQLLQSHVQMLDEGRASRVDYRGMMENQPAIDSYLQTIADIEQNTFDGWTNSEQLAFLINTYNAATVSLILTEYPNLDSIKDIGLIFTSPWKREFISLFGRTLSLDEIEHELIRGSGKYSEPRIHFAVNCAAIGCPALSNRAYFGDKLEQQLEEATRLFLSDRSRNYFSNNRLYVSSIFKWYREDFEKGWLSSISLEEFLGRYYDELGMDNVSAADLASNRIRIRFLRYDWNLNSGD